MTDREALRILSIPNSYRNFNSQVEVAKLIAFNAIKERVERSKVEYIEREAAKRALRIWITECVIDGDTESADRFRDCIDLLDSLDAADVAPVVHGEWIERALRPTCSLCGFSGSLIDAPISPFKYCPNCGAKMDGEEKR
jgi:hypothetical protein